VFWLHEHSNWVWDGFKSPHEEEEVRKKKRKKKDEEVSPMVSRGELPLSDLDSIEAIMGGFEDPILEQIEDFAEIKDPTLRNFPNVCGNNRTHFLRSGITTFDDLLAKYYDSNGFIGFLAWLKVNHYVTAYYLACSVGMWAIQNPERRGSKMVDEE
jgi:hypothetical protein